MEPVTGSAVPFATTLIKDVAAGLAGGAVMTAVEKAEQAVTGPTASFLHTLVRLAIDQTLENRTGVGAPPLSSAVAFRP